MNATLSRWLERNRVKGEVRGLMAQCLRKPAESAVAAYLFAGSEPDQEAALQQGSQYLSEFVSFATNHSRQVQRLRDLVARLPHAPERWSEFIIHELQRPQSVWKDIKPAAEVLASSLCSPTVGDWILGYVYSEDDLNRLDPERTPALAVAWKRRVFLALVDPIIAQARAQEGE